MTLAEAAARAEELARTPGNERELATLRTQWDDELEAAARNSDYRVRGVAYRAIAQFRYRQKLELLRRGLEDESAGARGSALIALTSLSGDHPGDVNAYRPALHELAVVCLRNGSADRGTIQLLQGMADDDEVDREVRDTARSVAAALVKKSRAK